MNKKKPRSSPSRTDEMRLDKRRRKRADRKGRRGVHAQQDEPAPSGASEPQADTEAGADTPVEPRPGEPAPAAGDLPLTGVRVIDVGNFLAGPYAASIMGEFGAEVLKVEHPIAGDPMRRFGTPTKRHDAIARLAVGGAQQEVGDHRPAAEARRRAVHPAGAPSRTCWWRTSAPARWRNGASAGRCCSEANPGLVMLRVSGYGQTGPYRRRPGFAHIAHAIGGLSYLAGFPGETPVVPGTAPLGDYISSLYGVIGVMLALRHKEETGRGQVIDIGIYEAVFRQMDELAASYGLFGKVREREGSGSFVAVPHGHFRCQGRQVGGDRVHHRQDVRAPVGGDGAAGAGLAPALRRTAQAAGGARRGQRHRHRVGRRAARATR